MSVSRFNSEGYHDPVVYEALTNMEKEQRAAFKAVHAYRPLVYICSPLPLRKNIQRHWRLEGISGSCL